MKTSIYLTFLVAMLLQHSAKTQYNYFDESYGISGVSQTSRAIFRLDSTYMTCNFKLSFPAFANSFAEINPSGNVVSEFDNDNEVVWVRFAKNDFYAIESGGYLYTSKLDHLSYIRKFSSQGEQLWERNFFHIDGIDTSFSRLSCPIQLPNNSILTVGVVGLDGSGVGLGSEEWKLVFVNLDTDGNTNWMSEIPIGSESFDPSGLFYMNNEDILVCGAQATYTDEFGLNLQHSIKKLNSTCDSILQEFTWGGWCREDRIIMHPMANGNYLVVYEECYDNIYGYPNYPDYYDRKFTFHLMEFNPISMTPMWIGQCFSNTINDSTWFFDLGPTDIVQCSDGGYLISVYHNAINGNYPGETSSILKVNADLEQEWFRTYQHSEIDTFADKILSVVESFDGGVITSGEIITANTFATKQWVLKLDACGDVEYNGCDFVSALEVSKDLKKGILMFPNPANEKCHLVLPADAMEVRLRDLMGKLVLRKNVSHETEVDLDLSQIGSGIYVVECEDVNGKLWSEKLVVE